MSPINTIIIPRRYLSGICGQFAMESVADFAWNE